MPPARRRSIRLKRRPSDSTSEDVNDITSSTSNHDAKSSTNELATSNGEQVLATIIRMNLEQPQRHQRRQRRPSEISGTRCQRTELGRILWSSLRVLLRVVLAIFLIGAGLFLAAVLIPVVLRPVVRWLCVFGRSSSTNHRMEISPDVCARLRSGPSTIRWFSIHNGLPDLFKPLFDSAIDVHQIHWGLHTVAGNISSLRSDVRVWHRIYVQQELIYSELVGLRDEVRQWEEVARQFRFKETRTRGKLMRDIWWLSRGADHVMTVTGRPILDALNDWLNTHLPGFYRYSPAGQLEAMYHDFASEHADAFQSLDIDASEVVSAIDDLLDLLDLLIVRFEEEITTRDQKCARPTNGWLGLGSPGPVDPVLSEACATEFERRCKDLAQIRGDLQALRADADYAHSQYASLSDALSKMWHALRTEVEFYKRHPFLAAPCPIGEVPLEQEALRNLVSQLAQEDELARERMEMAEERHGAFRAEDKVIVTARRRPAHEEAQQVTPTTADS